MSEEDNNDSALLNKQWLMDPTLYLDDYLSVCHLVCAAIGLPLNLSIMTAVIGYQRLRCQRCFSWLGIGFSNLFILVYYLTEFLSARWPSPITDELCALFNGLPCPVLLLNYFLSFIERRLCLKYSNWYKHRVNNKWILIAQIGSFLFLFLAFKGRHLFGAAPLRWQWSFPELKVFCGFFLGGFVLCLAGGAAVLTISSRPYPSIMADFEMTMMRITTVNGESDSDHRPSFDNPFVQIGEERVSKLDLEAARSLTISGVTLLLAASPALVALILLAECIQYGSPEELSGCSQWAKCFYYLRELLPVHCSFVSPIVFVVYSRDIRGALRDKFRYLNDYCLSFV